MKGNDLGNYVVPRDILVWEGLLGVLPDDPRVQAKAERYFRRKRWAKAAALFVTNDMLARQINELVFRYAVEIDLVTHQSPEFASVLEARMEAENIPVRRTRYEDPYALARSLAVSPHIRHVYFANPFNRFVFGSRGRFITPDQYLMFGAM